MTVIAALALGMSYVPAGAAQPTFDACPVGNASISTQEICWIDVGAVVHDGDTEGVTLHPTNIAWRMPANVNYAHVRVDHTDTTPLYASRDHFRKPGWSPSTQGDGIEVSTAADKLGNDDWNGFCRSYDQENLACSDWWGDHPSDGAVLPSDLVSIGGGKDSDNRVWVYPTDGRLCHQALGVFDGYYTPGQTGTYRMCFQARIKIEFGSNFQFLWIRDNHNGPTSVSSGTPSEKVQDVPAETASSGCPPITEQKDGYVQINWPGNTIVFSCDPFSSLPEGTVVKDVFADGTSNWYPHPPTDLPPPLPTLPPKDCPVPAQTLAHGQTLTCTDGILS